MMKRMVVGAALLATAPFAAQAQTPLQPGGFYIAAEGGANWIFNTSPTSTFTFAGPSSFGSFSSNSNAYFNTGFVVGGALGYDFIGLRVEAEGVYRENTGTLAVGGFSAGSNFNEVAIMGNVYYDFLAGSAIVPYIGAGAGVAFLNAGALGATRQSTQFAYQGIIGVGWNIDPMFRLNLEGRYYGTTAPNFSNQGSLGNTQYNLTYSPQNNNVSAMLSLHMRFGVAAPPPPPPPPPVVAPPSFMVFFDWDRSNLSAAGADHDRAGCGCLQGQGQRAHHGDRPHRHDGSGELQHGAVAASRQRGQGRSRPRRRAGPGDHGHRQGREPVAGADRRQRARAAEPPRRDRHPVGRANRRKKAASAAFLLRSQHATKKTAALREWGEAACQQICRARQDRRPNVR